MQSGAAPMWTNTSTSSAMTWPPVPPPPGVSAPTSYAAPAFTPVQVRQTFAQPYAYPPAHMALAAQPSPQAAYAGPAAAPAQQQKKKIEWPSSVRDYVQRSFLPENLDASVGRDEMEAKLKETITRANDENVMYTIDWTAMLLPQQMIKLERSSLRSAQLAAQQNPPTFKSSYSPDSLTKKRKSDHAFNDEPGPSALTPPWRANPHGAAPLGSRVSFASPEERQQQTAAAEDGAAKSKFLKQLEKRQKRFDGGYKSAYRSPSPEPSAGPVVGTCETLEKRYLRLTAAPVPSAVRPERVLRQTLELLKKRWKKEANYHYICDQFKSLRQDLTVQRIKNDLTVQAYEIHARIALEKRDLGEYNQCQTQLRPLYQLGLGGNPVEFKAYRILYFIHTQNRTALNDAMADLTPAEKEEPAIRHALNVRSALALGNYHRFFQLFMETPNMGAYLMDMFLGRERLAAMCVFSRAYKPHVSLRFVTEELGFDSDAEAAQFIVDHNGQDLLEERDGSISFLTGKAGSLFEAPKAAAFRRVDIKGQI